MHRLHSRLRMRNGAGWNPQMLFANGEQGVIYDPNRLDTLFQDSAGTVPVTAAGQPVGRMLDTSGRGNHANIPAAASRPILRLNATTGAYYLETDGADDFMSTAAIDFTATDKVSVFAGIRKLSDAAQGCVVELGPNTSSANGSFCLLAPASVVTPGANDFQSRGTLFSSVRFIGAAPISSVYSCESYIAGDAVSMRVNGSLIAQSSADQGAGNYGNNPLYLFRRGGTSLPFNGHFYGLIIVGRLASTTEITNIERIFANKTGVTLA